MSKGYHTQFLVLGLKLNKYNTVYVIRVERLLKEIEISKYRSSEPNL